MYGEGWAGNTVYDPVTCSGEETFMCIQTNSAELSTRIGFFNDQIRDGIKAGVFDGATAKGFVNGNQIYAKNISYGILGNSFGHGTWTAAAPSQCVTYASCHDNMTLYDKLVGANYPNTTDYRARYADVIRQNKLTAAIISSCQGLDFILAGEEMGRSKDGDENSYKSAASLNMIDWSLLVTNADLVSYYKGLFELRKAFSPFTASTLDSKDDSFKYNRTTSLTASTNTIGYTVENLTEGEWNKIAVIYNGKNTAVNFKLSATADKKINNNTEWVIVVNDKAAGVTALGENTGLTFSVPANTCVIAVEKSTFEEVALQSQYSRVIVNSVYDKTGEQLAGTTLLGSAGSTYTAAPDASIPLQYELDHVEGEEKGVYTDADTVVTYHYGDFIPSSFLAENGDVDDDGDITIIDGTVIQRHLAGLERLDAEHEARGDYDYSGETTIIDVTKLQRFLAGLQVNVCKITTRYKGYNPDLDKTSYISTTNISYVRLGDTYVTTPENVAYYELDEMPGNACGVASEDVVVTYNYTYAVNSPVIHVKHDGDLTWAPCLWAWSYEGTKPVNSYDAWPGLMMTDPDEDGWYTTTFPTPGGLDYYFIISKSGSPQTADYGPIVYDEYPEIWVVINDDQVGKNGTWVSYYNYNPDLAGSAE